MMRAIAHYDQDGIGKGEHRGLSDHRQQGPRLHPGNVAGRCAWGYVGHDAIARTDDSLLFATVSYALTRFIHMYGKSGKRRLSLRQYGSLGRSAGCSSFRHGLRGIGGTVGASSHRGWMDPLPSSRST